MEINSGQHLFFEDYSFDHEESNSSSQNPFISISHEKEILRCCSTSVNGSCRVDSEVARTSSSAHFNMQPNDDKGCVKTMERGDVGFKIVFRTESDLEIMDDGYKWRKYGKKKLKNSPYPRNYYRCSAEACKVKKRVEREREDPRFVITTYQGKHNHQNHSLS